MCSDVFDAYLAHCESRLRRDDMAAATVRSYRKILDCVWRPKIGHLIFSQVRYSRLVAIADGHRWSKKTYNNTISVLKRAFEFGYRDRPFHENPAVNLRCARLRKSDRPKVDPFCMHDAEALIAAIHRDWGEAQGNYDEFRFFTGLKTLQSLKLRYRRPYTARQTSVSWNLMAGKNALWVAKQHGHSIATMLRAYAAWAEGATEVDVEAIKRSMNDEGPPVATNLQQICQ